MARILFIVNEHPNEAFDISVARETAKLLMKQGHTVIFRKFKRKETMLGLILKSNPGQEPKKEKLDRIHWSSREKVKRLLAEIKPDRACIFHCTPNDIQTSNIWADGTDFRISSGEGYGERNNTVDIIEIKAHYQPLPERISKRTRRFATELEEIGEHYLTKVTSNPLTRAAGLHPENFAKAIASIITKRTLEHYYAKPYYYESGKISRKTLKKTERKPIPKEHRWR